MRVTADRRICVGAGMCVLAAPEIFDQDDDGIVKVLRTAPEEGEEAAAGEAAHLCPSGAVQIEE
jgi:ferredoxin